MRAANQGVKNKLSPMRNGRRSLTMPYVIDRLTKTIDDESNSLNPYRVRTLLIRRFPSARQRCRTERFVSLLRLTFDVLGRNGKIVAETRPFQRVINERKGKNGRQLVQNGEGRQMRGGTFFQQMKIFSPSALISMRRQTSSKEQLKLHSNL